VRLRISRPGKLSTWLFLALALMLAPQIVGAAVGISRQQSQINAAREDSRAVATRLGRIAHLQSMLDATEDAVLREPGEERRPAGPRVRGTLTRANADVLALRDPAITREFDRLEALAAGSLDTAVSLRRLEPPLDRLRSATARLADTTVDHAVEQQIRGHAEQSQQLLGVIGAFALTLLITLFLARFFVASIRRPLRSLRSSARKLGSGDLSHRVELDSFTELNQVADAFNAMAEALRTSDRELTHRAFHDSLTGLANRALLFDRVGHALARRRPEGDHSTTGVLFIDIDDFKTINDTLGHSRGDDVLVEIGRRIRGVLRPSDTVARFGGDEFAVLLEDLAGSEAAARVAERILLALSSPVWVADREVDVRASIGVAVAGGEVCDADGLVRAADLAMYAAKGAGKDRYSVFEPSMLHGAVDRLELERDLKRAILADELDLYYQPVVDMASGRARGVEALARWIHPERGFIPPDVFIPLAEQSGMIVPLGRRLLTRACDDLPALRRGLDEPGLIVAVNLSAAELLAPGLPEHILRSVEVAGISPDSLILEITESQIMSDLDAAVARMHELVALGINLALDDFGTGYSSLAYLRSFPLNALKIDRAFIEGIADPDSEDHALVRAIISLGEALDLRVVAEGIETEEQRRELNRLGCDRGQGYLFSRPMPPKELVIEFGGRAVVGYS
jgi:diguanylate cyclase (GGDEF)-like protein